MVASIISWKLMRMVFVYNEDVKLIGSNYVNELRIPYSEINGVKYIDGGGLLPWIVLILDVKGKSYPMDLDGKNPYKLKIAGSKNREPALQLKKIY